MDDARAAVATRGLVAEASRHLTETVAMRLEFEQLSPFKTALKRFFSDQPWTEKDAAELSDLVSARLAPTDRWKHVLDDDLTLVHGMTPTGYEIRVEGTVEREESIWDRVFSGRVLPEQTPHPRKVKFTIGGAPAPGRWYRRGENDIDDPRAAALLDETDVTDVMVAGDFVTVGLDRSSTWEERLVPILQLVEQLFEPDGSDVIPTDYSREDLVAEGSGLRVEGRPEDLHLLDPDDDHHRARLIEALGAEDPRQRRAAVATLALSADADVANAAILTGYADSSRIVRRTAVDAAADLERDDLRPLFEQALTDEDAWIRWKAVTAIDAIGVEPSRETLILAIADPEFAVRFEAERVLRS